MLQPDGADPAENGGDPIARADLLVFVEGRNRSILAQVLTAPFEQDLVETPDQIDRVGGKRLRILLIYAALLAFSILF